MISSTDLLGWQSCWLKNTYSSPKKYFSQKLTRAVTFSSLCELIFVQAKSLHDWHCRERRAESRESRGGSRSRGSQSVDRMVADNCQREAASRVGREEVKRSVREEVGRGVKPRGRRGLPVPRLEAGYPPSGVGLLWQNHSVPDLLNGSNFEPVSSGVLI